LRGKCSFKCASSACLSAPLHSFTGSLATHWSTERRASSLIVVLPVPNGTARRSQHTHALDSRAACMNVYMHSRAACMDVHTSSDSAQGCGAPVTCVYGLCFFREPLSRDLGRSLPLEVPCEPSGGGKGRWKMSTNPPARARAPQVMVRGALGCPSSLSAFKTQPRCVRQAAVRRVAWCQTCWRRRRRRRTTIRIRTAAVASLLLSVLRLPRCCRCHRTRRASTCTFDGSSIGPSRAVNEDVYIPAMVDNHASRVPRCPRSLPRRVQHESWRTS
jgi:hypothetical protein